MFCLQFAFKDKTKKITIPKNINNRDLENLIAHSFRINERIIGLTNKKGQFLNFDQLKKAFANYEKDLLYLVTTQDVDEDNMSFASDNHDKPTKRIPKLQQHQHRIPQAQQIPQKSQGFYQGVIGDLSLFEQLLLEENEAAVVFCFIKQKPKNVYFPYYLYHTSKNSAIVYVGKNRICQFFISNMSQIPKSIDSFVRQLVKTQPQTNIETREEEYQDEYINGQNDEGQAEQEQKLTPLQEQYYQPQAPLPMSSSSQKQQEQLYKEQAMRASLLENLLKLRDHEQISELQFYKMKSELLESISDFMRKYQMGTRKGFRRHKNEVLYSQNSIPNNIKRDSRRLSQQGQRQRDQKTPQSKNQMRQQAQSRDQRRFKKYEIPIIVRKYNNVIQKISTSYPLSQQQQQKLKGLISEKQSGIYKSSILQEDPDIFPLFQDYFNEYMDQLQLVNKLKSIKRVNSEKKQRDEHNMRLLTKYAVKNNFEFLKKLLLEKNVNVLTTFEKFKVDRNCQLLTERLQKIAQLQKQRMVVQYALN